MIIIPFTFSLHGRRAGIRTNYFELFWGGGRARHSVRDVGMKENAILGKRRRAEDCPPYLHEASWASGGRARGAGETISPFRLRAFQQGSRLFGNG
jgi:hypothetical protein